MRRRAFSALAALSLLLLFALWPTHHLQVRLPDAGTGSAGVTSVTLRSNHSGELRTPPIARGPSVTWVTPRPRVDGLAWDGPNDWRAEAAWVESVEPTVRRDWLVCVYKRYAARAANGVGERAAVDGIVHSLWIPAWRLLPLLAVLPTWWTVSRVRRWLSADRRAYRAARGQCRDCGYDLTGNTSGQCPECGTTVAGTPIDSPTLRGARPPSHEAVSAASAR